jgi:hypothetical protein
MTYVLIGAFIGFISLNKHVWWLIHTCQLCAILQMTGMDKDAMRDLFGAVVVPLLKLKTIDFSTAF